jgi:hypothetical protein
MVVPGAAALDTFTTIAEVQAELRSVSKIFVPTVFHRPRPSWMQAPWEQQSEDR